MTSCRLRCRKCAYSMSWACCEPAVSSGEPFCIASRKAVSEGRVASSVKDISLRGRVATMSMSSSLLKMNAGQERGPLSCRMPSNSPLPTICRQQATPHIHTCRVSLSLVTASVCAVPCPSNAYGCSEARDGTADIDPLLVAEEVAEHNWLAPFVDSHAAPRLGHRRKSKKPYDFPETFEHRLERCTQDAVLVVIALSDD
mmetsp:Transcript_30485/g.88617  ORF Transcript_30485/g.88617 Transcript_30485/m.88617 type:complete len:200 (-) Transcript_30485:1003-1602(-)